MKKEPFIIRSPGAMSRWSAGLKGMLGFVPTLGALHEGHASLIERARRENDVVAVSVFVNPLQFTPEGFKKYPRTLAADAQLARAAGASVIFAPSPEQMYPAGFQSQIALPPLFDALKGQNIEWHYRGVLQVVMKLIQIVLPDRIYFGLKDPHQLALIERMAADFNLPVEIRRCPTVREPDGLARSSRNALLTPPERAAAPVIYRALCAAQKALRAGETPARAMRILAKAVAAEPLARLEYAEIVDPATFLPVRRGAREALVYAAVWIGEKRLADNIRFRLK